VFDSLTRKLTYANVVATVAVFLALGGGAYAAFRLPANSVSTRQIKNRAVTGRKLAHGAVTGSKVAPGSLTGTQIKASTLGTVPSATHASSADTATNATHASSADTATNATTAQNLAGPEAFHQVGAPGEPGFQNSWLNRGFTADEPAGFYKDAEGVVHLEGAVKGGAPNNVIFQLPPGYRPTSGKDLLVAAACECQAVTNDPQGGAVTVLLQTGAISIVGSGISATVDGGVSLANTSLQSGGRVSLDGITFRAGS
jgi:hypothetical protein